ncbi:glycosyltransferase family 2 protein [Ruegeria lacuscaerulensis]|uniref:glycosyltransferase family 2 protein n=1 Tax=Ruegeria lacuscaerulensis TaxID=55218 RepID=UPI00147F8B96|nr:glycosyltransferase [Ruegeria lacuscaerulensis]
MNILGVVRNGGESLTETLLRIEQLRAQLDSSRVIIATNDNSDNTDDILQDYAAMSAGVDILFLDSMAGLFEERVERIAAARNTVLEHLLTSSPIHPLTLVLDMDGPNTQMDPIQVLNAAVRQVPQWDAVFANSLPAYYDLYALRCAGWCEQDPWRELAALKRPRMFRSVWWRRMQRKIIYSRQYSMPPDTPMIEVDSAFGGLGLYKTEALHGATYRPRDETGHVTCEHTTLHLSLRNAGKRLFIDPGLTALAQTEHMGPGSGKRIPKKLLQ